MSIQSGEILETVKMVADQNFDVRTITIGIDLHDCISSDINVLNQNIYNKITTVGKDLVATAKYLSAKYGVPIVNQRISVTPIAQIAAAPMPTPMSAWRKLWIRQPKLSACRLLAAFLRWCKKVCRLRTKC